jgi:CYTH domain-containing protein/CHAD domain-containing protein
VGYEIDPDESVRREVRRIAAERLDDAIERLIDIVDAETAVHETRKRCKEVRGLARLIAPALGDQFKPFDRTVRAAANQLSALRDAHALLATFDTLLDAHDLDTELRTVRDRQAALASEATLAVEDGDARIAAARELLVDARRRSQRWRVDNEFATIGDGLRATYRDGRTTFRRARREPTDEHVHEWRKSVKYLWYQTRLLRDVAPSVLGASIEQLDLLSEALGDDHDLAVLVAGLDADPDRFGDAAAVDHTRLVARQQQQELRRGAFRAGAIVFAEPADAFTARLRRYWRIRVDDGPEVTVGGIAALAEAVEKTGSPSTIERERKYLVEQIPAELDLSDRVELRQGYLVTGERVAVRVRDAGREGRTLTIKAGRGTSSAERTELEWRIGKEQFEAVWPLTAGRRVVKTRHRIPAAGHVIELDVFGEQLEGLIVAEVEFSSMEALESFVSPDWFGPEVTDDRRYNNAALAISGLPDPSA